MLVGYMFCKLSDHKIDLKNVKFKEEQQDKQKKEAII